MREYVGGEEGLLWQGLSDDYGAHVWQHDPFRAANLLIAISLLADLPLHLRSDPTAISRHLTYVIGERVCYGKWGEGNYVTGQPSNGYRCRTKRYLQRKGRAHEWAQRCSDPSTWTSSSPLLEQHWGLVQSGSKATAVQYCQCFVFSGVTTTIGRALGIATRSVTNFQSAHDTNADRGISKFFFASADGAWSPADYPEDLCPNWCTSPGPAAQRGCQLSACKRQLSTGRGFAGICAPCMPCMPCSSNTDSVWSFHVWNEMFFDRNGTGADGWQAVDATPQEESAGRFQMGPASVNQVKQGASDCYDTDFVIGEVNGDVKLFVYSVPDFSEDAKDEAAAKGTFVLHDGDPLYAGIRWYHDPFGDVFNAIGFKAVSKKPGPISADCRKDYMRCRDEELDLTGFYKKCPDPHNRAADCQAGPAQAKAHCLEPGASSFMEGNMTMMSRDDAMGRSEGRLLHELSRVQDVEVNFSSFLPVGSIVIEKELPLKVSFHNLGSETRTIRLLVTATGCDYRGRPVVHIQTRRKKYAMQLPLDGSETQILRQLKLGPGEEYVFQHTVHAANLDADMLSSLEVNAAEGTFFLQFHINAYVVETGQRFAHEPRRRLVEVPTTFNEMFLFNAAVMGFGQSTWMHLVLDQFDDIVSNVANSYRLQEECDVLSLVLAQHPGSIRLSEFKAVMLASLRSLVPKEWDSNHEVAWNWLWENVERMLRSHMGKPQAHEEALGRFILSLSESSILFLRQELYRQFFAVAPAGQDYFKQSTTRLYFIADKIIEMTIEIFRSPRQMVVDISALGLRHVGYEVPTELFAPFVSAAVDVVRGMTSDDVAEAAFRWSLTLVSKILVRTVLEGSTIVMKAINTNQEKALRKAIAVAPRGRRATELLEIRVGTQSISPLFWAIESGSLNCGKAMIQDLLTIRADRDNYYYGCDDLFTRHPNIIQKLCAESPTMLKPLLDGLVWRSRITFQGKRRVNYYLKHLVQNQEGKFNQALEWLCDFKDPKIISHSVVALFADIVWNRLAMYYFLLTRLYFLLTLCVFATSQALLGSRQAASLTEEELFSICRGRCDDNDASCHLQENIAIFAWETRLFVNDWRHGAMERLFSKIPIPEFLCSGQELGNMLLLWMLIFMCIQEPIWWCIPDTYGDFPGAGLFTSSCPAGEQHREAYAAFSCAAMLLYCLLILDLSIVSMRISAFVLVCGRVIVEVGLFLMAAAFLILSFALGISTLDRQSPSFEGTAPSIGNAAFSLFAMTLGLYPSDNLSELKDYVGVLITVSIFTILIAVFLLNLLIAQLNQAYQIIFPDMQGYARLNRASVIVSTVDQVSQKRWSRFLQSLNLDERLEFNEGDVGLAGRGIKGFGVDSIRRFGGSTSTTMPWPEDERQYSDEDRFERLEKLMIRATKGSRKKGHRTSGLSSGGATSNSSGGTMLQSILHAFSNPTAVAPKNGSRFCLDTYPAVYMAVYGFCHDDETYPQLERQPPQSTKVGFRV
ncbi:Tgm3 [Symbiodinium pilosum]|uniref:Tgm3 protein n=1 Tax=Symbiodinium pilosum TaxID=2952 RepID=A0A812RMG3_SYMPI|nr:Tgm3 [Symbiodinium pilosum]